MLEFITCDSDGSLLAGECQRMEINHGYVRMVHKYTVTEFSIFIFFTGVLPGFLNFALHCVVLGLTEMCVKLLDMSWQD